MSKKSSSQDLFDEFNELVKTKYQLPDKEEFLKLDYKERNKRLYDVLKHYRICVVPGQKVESYDHLPHFMIIETSLRDIKRMPKGRRGKDEKGGSVKAQTEKRNKLTRFDPRNVKGNIELFQHINEIQSLKLRKMFD